MVGPPLDYLRSSGGLLLDGGIHTLDLARHVGGEIDEISAFGTALSDPSYGELGDVDNALVVVRFSTGALGVIDHSRVAGYGFDCRLELLGSLKSARIEADKTPELQWLSPGWRAVEQPSSFLERFPVAYRLELEAFIAALALGQPVRAGGHEALLAATLCGAANEALRTGRPVPIHASAASAIRAVAAGHSVI
jgi:myo-inositol 2-dehydrogenase/D-chiro-inositol 1-dehydrogenase